MAETDISQFFKNRSAVKELCKRNVLKYQTIQAEALSKHRVALTLSDAEMEVVLAKYYEEIKPFRSSPKKPCEPVPSQTDVQG